MSPEIEKIIRRLIEKTKKKQVKWRPAADFLIESLQDWDYAVSTPYSTINIFRYNPTDENGAIDTGVQINILNSKGTIIHNEIALRGQEDFPLLNELLQVARGTVLESDETLKLLKDALSDDSILGDSGDDIPF